MRQTLISILLLSLVAGCSSVNIGPHKIDVQQGNALDQENVSRLKVGLNRSQVRFLLGTPLVVDPFRTDRWDYVYVNYKAGKLAEQKRITLFFDGEVLARIEGDVPAVEPVQPVPAPKPEPETALQPKVEISTLPPVAESRPAAVPLASRANPEQPAKVAQPLPTTAADKPVATAPDKPSKPVNAAPAVAVASTVAASSAVPKPALAPIQKPEPKAAEPAAATPSQAVSAPVTSTVVPPLPSPKNVPAYVDPRTPAEPSLQPETDVTKIRPDVIPSFPEPNAAAAASDDPVLQSVNDWVQAWVQRDEAAYLSAYDIDFVPQGGGTRSDWEKRRRLLLALAKNIDLKIDAPVVQRESDRVATVTFNQYYRSDSYRDAVVKQLRLVERDGNWLITDEKVLSILRGSKP